MSDVVTSTRHIERRADRSPAPAADEDLVVFLSQADFDALLEYSCSLPTGTTIGKRWKRRIPYDDRDIPPEGPAWWLGEYYDNGDPGMVGIRWTRIVVVVE